MPVFIRLRYSPKKETYHRSKMVYLFTKFDRYSFELQCMRGMETDFPQPRGEKKTQMSKYLAGGGALCVIIGLIWFPLLLFALGGTVGVSNLPYEVSMKIAIGPYEPIYSMSAQTSSIIEYSEEEYKNFTDLYTQDKAAITFLENYINTDVAVIKLSGFSRKLWDISPPDKIRFASSICFVNL